MIKSSFSKLSSILYSSAKEKPPKVCIAASAASQEASAANNFDIFASLPQSCPLLNRLHPSIKASSAANVREYALATGN